MPVHLSEMPQPQLVSSFSEHATSVPSDEADWAGLDSSTTLVLRDELIFEDAGLAIVGDAFNHKYQFRTSAATRDIKSIQDDVGVFDKFDPDENGIVLSTDRPIKYSFEEQLQHLCRTILTDGYLHDNRDIAPSDVSLEYTPAQGGKYYNVLLKW
jgi:hypothetical protein